MAKIKLHVNVFEIEGIFQYSKLKQSYTRFHSDAISELRQAMAYSDDLHGIKNWFDNFMKAYPKFTNLLMEDCFELKFNEAHNALTLFKKRFKPGLEDTQLMIIKLLNNK